MSQFAGVVAGARLTAQEMVERSPGRSYVETLDTVLGRLERGIPLADLPIVSAPRSPLAPARGRGRTGRPIGDSPCPGSVLALRS